MVSDERKLWFLKFSSIKVIDTHKAWKYSTNFVTVTPFWACAFFCLSLWTNTFNSNSWSVWYCKPYFQNKMLELLFLDFYGRGRVNSFSPVAPTTHPSYSEYGCSTRVLLVLYSLRYYNYLNAIHIWSMEWTEINFLSCLTFYILGS